MERMERDSDLRNATVIVAFSPMERWTGAKYLDAH